MIRDRCRNAGTHGLTVRPSENMLRAFMLRAVANIGREVLRVQILDLFDCARLRLSNRKPPIFDMSSQKLKSLREHSIKDFGFLARIGNSFLFIIYNLPHSKRSYLRRNLRIMNALNILATFIDKLDTPIRKRKIDNLTVLTCLDKILRGWTWKDLKYLHVNPSTIYARFKKWKEKGILERAWSDMMETYSEHQLRHDPYHFNEIYIDCSFIKNVLGVDCVGRNPTDRGKLGSKASIICDKNQTTISITFYPANIPDVSTTIDAVDHIVCKIKKDNRYGNNTLLADKGYISEQNTSTLLDRKIKLLTPLKKPRKQITKIKPVTDSSTQQASAQKSRRRKKTTKPPKPVKKLTIEEKGNAFSSTPC
jgi:hypothetical protein